MAPNILGVADNPEKQELGLLRKKGDILIQNRKSSTWLHSEV